MRISYALASMSLLLATAACDGKYSPFNPAYDPLVREGLWQPAHSNRQNLTLQVADPGDLVHGTGTTGADGQLAAAAVDRLRNDKVKKLPASDVAQVTVQSSGNNDSSSQGGQ